MEALLGPDARFLLQQIGEALDDRRPVEVRDHGLVSLGSAPPALVQEKCHGKRQRQGGPPAGSRSRSPGWKRAADGTASSQSRVGGLRAGYEGQLGKLQAAYPTLKLFPDNHGMWLQVESSVMEGLHRKATFLVALPTEPGFGPLAWAFWSSEEGHQWIGPRHTNFFSGTVCAFAESDRAWREGGDLCTLIDLYTVWAFRHLHLDVMGRWAGKQYALAGHEPYYRRMEFKDDELCSCPSGRRYRECCKPSDMVLDGLMLKTAFEAAMGRAFRERAPHRKIVDFTNGSGPLPAIEDIHIPVWNALARRPRGKEKR